MKDLREFVPQVRKLLESRFGLALDGISDNELKVTILGATTPEQVGPALLNDPQFFERIVDRLPIDESSLFRNPELWDWMHQHALPPLVERALTSGRMVRAISIGCSSGQEPYSLGIVLQHLLQDQGIVRSSASHFAFIRGVDASPSRIERARSGLLNSWSVHRARASWIEGHVHPHPTQFGFYQVDASVLAMSEFGQINVLHFVDGGPSLAGYDVVMCQHVLIYFRETVAMAILEGITRTLDPGALMIMAPVEAHLLERMPRLEPLPFIGAARVREKEKPLVAPRQKPVKRRGHPRANAVNPAKRVSLDSAPGAPHGESARQAPVAQAQAPAPQPAALPTPSPVRHDSKHALVEQYLKAAFEHVAGGRTTEALQAARAASFVDSKSLMARMLMGQLLLLVNPSQGRRVLKDLQEHASKLPADEAVPMAAELTVAQLLNAVRLLLEGKEG